MGNCCLPMERRARRKPRTKEVKKKQEVVISSPKRRRESSFTESQPSDLYATSSCSQASVSRTGEQVSRASIPSGSKVAVKEDTSSVTIKEKVEPSNDVVQEKAEPSSVVDLKQTVVKEEKPVSEPKIAANKLIVDTDNKVVTVDDYVTKVTLSPNKTGKILVTEATHISTTKKSKKIKITKSGTKLADSQKSQLPKPPEGEKNKSLIKLKSRLPEPVLKENVKTVEQVKVSLPKPSRREKPKPMKIGSKVKEKSTKAVVSEKQEIKMDANLSRKTERSESSKPESGTQSKTEKSDSVKGNFEIVSKTEPFDLDKSNVEKVEKTELMETNKQEVKVTSGAEQSESKKTEVKSVSKKSGKIEASGSIKPEPKPKPEKQKRSKAKQKADSTKKLKKSLKIKTKQTSNKIIKEEKGEKEESDSFKTNRSILTKETETEECSRNEGLPPLKLLTVQMNQLPPPPKNGDMFKLREITDLQHKSKTEETTILTSEEKSVKTNKKMLPLPPGIKSKILGEKSVNSQKITDLQLLTKRNWKDSYMVVEIKKRPVFLPTLSKKMSFDKSSKSLTDKKDMKKYELPGGWIIDKLQNDLHKTIKKSKSKLQALSVSMLKKSLKEFFETSKDKSKTTMESVLEKSKVQQNKSKSNIVKMHHAKLVRFEYAGNKSRKR